MKNAARKERGTTRRVADAALDVAVGGTVLAVDKALETVEKASDRAEEAIREGHERVDEARHEAGDAVRTTRRKIEREIAGNDTRPYEERTRDELYQLAVERDIEGRSAMLKSDLITALRAER